MRPVSFWFGVVVLAICQGSGAQKFAKAEKGAPAAPRRRPRPKRPHRRQRMTTTPKPSPRWSRRSRRRSTRATPRRPPRPSPRTPSSSTSRASGPRAAPPSRTNWPRRSRTIPAARSPSRRGPAFPRPRHGARGGPDDHHPGRGRAARDHPLHRRLRQARWPVAPVGRPRRARPRPHPPRPPQGTGVAGRRLDQREPGCGRPHHLQVDRRRQLPGPRVHHEDPGPAGALGHAADRLGPARGTSSRPGSSTPRAASARATGPATATSG